MGVPSPSCGRFFCYASRGCGARVAGAVRVRESASPGDGHALAFAAMGDATEEITDALDPARAAALHAALGRSGPPPGLGDPLPPYWHQIYFWRALPSTALGDDGHPMRGAGLIPDFGLPRRMWAGGRLTFHTPLRAGIRATRVSRCIRAEEKTGRTGPLAIVTLRHEIRQRGALTVSEEQDLVYRAADAPPGRPPDRPAAADHREVRTFDSTLLFRYSALTFNGHRIHYDADYSRGVEGYSGLVVHGPLLATLMMDLAVRQGGALTGFSFRATAPLSLPGLARFAIRGADLWAEDDTGRVLMVGQAAWG
ncbi:HTD2 family dehydratase [Ovoidimarina sediminis]|uniref:FAS1-like dehydratase domain-containing protein n=1 Tax=Ovoidimarina sediminis TaxID=3079856 RepID=UPI00290EAC42|nr:MaoC family dehydratase N-terminal domain-containing protein [Rhodophyticola sp. MJ-SS7]MDU8943930.1 MaoC family dehydratase N-terminal domain-containing protein [Rhodophyticola sp. MJ-SS7]